MAVLLLTVLISSPIDSNAESKLKKLFNGHSIKFENAPTNNLSSFQGRADYPTEVANFGWVSGSWFFYDRYLITYNYGDNINFQWGVDELGDTISKTSFTYGGPAGQLTEWLQESWIGGVLSNLNRVLYSYDTQGGQTLFDSQYWDGSNWVSGYAEQTTFTYNAGNQATEVVRSQWVDSLSMFVDYYKDEFVYDANGNQTEETNFYWDGAAWVEDFRFTVTYDGSNVAIEGIQWEWNGASWDEVAKFTNIVWQNWDGSIQTSDALSYLIQAKDSLGVWEDIGRGTSTYGPFGVLTELEEVWDGAAWQNDYLYSTSYDSEGRVTESKDEEWDGAAWDQDWGSTTAYTDDGSGNLIEEIEMNWDDSATAYINSFKYEYSNYIFLGVSQSNPDQQVVVYPNPVSSTMLIRANDVQGGSVVNLLGQVVLQIQKGAQTVNMMSLADGVYIVRLQIKEGPILNNYTFKIIKE